MPDFAYYLSRERERDRTRTSTSPPPLPRRTSFKRRFLFSSDEEDDGHDDYPYSGAHRPSRALIPRNTPSQLERWNIWSDSRKSERCDSGAEEDEREKLRRRTVSFSLPDELDADEETEFRLRIARLRERRSPQPALRRYHAESDDERVRPSAWSGEMFRRRERCVSEDYEARERARSRSRERRRRERIWCDGDDGEEVVEREFEGERVVRIRRVKRTRTDEWRPLNGFRRC